MLAGLLVTLVLLGSLYFATQRVVKLEINGVAFQHRTHQATAGGVLRELGVTLQDADVLTAPSAAELREGAALRIEAARRVLLIHDDALSQAATQATDVAGALAALDVALQANDQLTLAGAPCTPDTPLPAPDGRNAGDARRWLAEVRRPLALTLLRAVAFTLQDGEQRSTLLTTARTVGEALYAQGVALYEGDRVAPSLASALEPEMVVQIERARPVTLDLGGQGKLLRTCSPTVREMLSAEGVQLGPKDYVLPDPRSAVTSDLHVRVVRVEDAYYLEEVPIPFEVRYEPDPEMEIDLNEVAVWGLEGAHRRRIRVHYENDREIYRAEEEEWIAREPVDRVIDYGTQIVVRATGDARGHGDLLAHAAHVGHVVQRRHGGHAADSPPTMAIRG